MRQILVLLLLCFAGTLAGAHTSHALPRLRGGLDQPSLGEPSLPQLKPMAGRGRRGPRGRTRFARGRGRGRPRPVRARRPTLAQPEAELSPTTQTEHPEAPVEATETDRAKAERAETMEAVDEEAAVAEAVDEEAKAAVLYEETATVTPERRQQSEEEVLEAIRAVFLWKEPKTSAIVLAAGNAAFAAAAFGPFSAATSFGGLAFWLVLVAVPFALAFQALAPGAIKPAGSIPRSLASVALSFAAALPSPLQPGGEILPPAMAAVAARTFAVAVNRAFAALRSAAAVQSRAHTVRVLIACWAVRTIGNFAHALPLLWATFLLAFSLPYLYIEYSDLLHREVTEPARRLLDESLEAARAAVAGTPLAGLLPSMRGNAEDEKEDASDDTTRS
eukprot:scaffold318249_cov27-Tisochrysis_lutea.AAC.3